MIKWSDVKIGVTPISKVIVIGKSKPIKVTQTWNSGQTALMI